MDSKIGLRLGSRGGGLLYLYLIKPRWTAEFYVRRVHLPLISPTSSRVMSNKCSMLSRDSMPRTCRISRRNACDTAYAILTALFGHINNYVDATLADSRKDRNKCSSRSPSKKYEVASKICKCAEPNFFLNLSGQPIPNHEAQHGPWLLVWSIVRRIRPWIRLCRYFRNVRGTLSSSQQHRCFPTLTKKKLRI